MQYTPLHPPIPTNVLDPPPIDARRDCEHFHGRALELQGLLDAAADLPTSLVAITGAPGAGKTSLLAEFRKRLPEHIARILLEVQFWKRVEHITMNPVSRCIVKVYAADPCSQKRNAEIV